MKKHLVTIAPKRALTQPPRKSPPAKAPPSKAEADEERRQAMSAENKTSAELRRELDATNAEAEATSAKISEMMATGDPSNKTVDAISREQTRIGLLYVKAQRLKHQIRAAQRAELVAEVERLTAEIERLKGENEAAIEATFAAVYPHLRYRDSAAHEWHERRAHEVRHLCKTAHEPGEIEAQLHDAKLHHDQALKELAKMDAQQVED